jgi:hypothetical protein
MFSNHVWIVALIVRFDLAAAHKEVEEGIAHPWPI